MKLTYGGVTIDAPQDVLFVDVDRGHPVFHGRLFPPPDGDFERLYTRCGQVATFIGAARIPTRHAVRIGRPCATCWPELRRHPGLFTRPRHPRVEHRQEALV